MATPSRWDRPPRGRKHWLHPLRQEFVEALRAARAEIGSDAFHSVRDARLAGEISCTSNQAWASAGWQTQRQLRRLATAVGYTGPIVDRSEVA